MNSYDDLIPQLPPMPVPDTLLEVKEDGYLLDGKPVSKQSLHAELVRTAGLGRKMIEIRASETVNMKRVKYVLDALYGADFDCMTVTSAEMLARKEGK